MRERQVVATAGPIFNCSYALWNGSYLLLGDVGGDFGVGTVVWCIVSWSGFREEKGGKI